MSQSDKPAYTACDKVISLLTRRVTAIQSHRLYLLVASVWRLDDSKRDWVHTFQDYSEGDAETGTALRRSLSQIRPATSVCLSMCVCVQRLFVMGAHMDIRKHTCIKVCMYTCTLLGYAAHLVLIYELSHFYAHIYETI